MTEIQLSSPIKEIPECWKDDKRMNVLFSPFRKRELNPIDYDSKLKFWNKVILQWCLENNECTLTLTTLKNVFKRKGRTPSCLVTVVEELLRSGDLRTRREFLSLRVPQRTWTGWAVDTLFKGPVTWSFLKLKDALAEVDINEVHYVCMEYLKIKGDSILLEAKSKTRVEHIKDFYTIEEIRSFVEPPECSVETAGLLLHWLKLEGKACSEMCEDHELIKLAVNPGPLQINDKDIAQHKLVKSKEVLLKAISLLEEEKRKAINDAKEHISKGLRIAAKSSLRKKKALDECITKRISTLDNLDLLLTRIRDAQSDAEVFESYKMGLSALKITFQEAGLTGDTAADTIADIEEVSEIQDEIQNALSHQLQLNTESELEDELSSILSAVELDEQIRLPDVPQGNLPEKTETKGKNVEPMKFMLLK